MPNSEQARSPSRLRPETPIEAIPGIGPKRAEALKARGIEAALDLVFHLPSRYQDWRTRTAAAELKPGMIATVEGDLSKISERPMRGARWRRLATGSLIADGMRIRVVWFNLPAYMRGYIPGGERVLLHGRISESAEGGLEITQPEIHALSAGAVPPIRAVYNLPNVIGLRLFSALVLRALEDFGDSIKGAVPAEVETGLPKLSEALRFLHAPPNDSDIEQLRHEQASAHAALAFDELFAFELAMCIERQRSARRAGVALDGPRSLTGRFLETLPFELTNGQRTAIAEIEADLARPGQMNRMLMGDVGSGKTLVAFSAILRAVESGWQAAMMAPTELLTEQHFQAFHKLCGKLGVRAALLTGNVTAGARSQVMRGLQTGEIQVVFGTHALIQEKVRIQKLGVGVIDEQHRFGVFDRARLKELGPTANVVMMPATPIPRSLAMTLFANLDVSFLDEMPPGRTPIKTEIVSEDDISRVDQIARDELIAGRRAYYIVPSIEAESIESDSGELRSVSAMAERLRRGALKQFKIGIMHGRMRADDKERTMREFRDGAIEVLVSTTVVEVGIDVPEATVIAIIAAEHFGLAQLHQLRGRVGRGQWPSRCCLVASRDADENALRRLHVLVASASGAEVSRADLEMRGPGDLLGARQAGALPLRFVHLVRDYRMIERARNAAEQWLKRDPALESAASQGARLALRKLLALGFSMGDVG
ncbi:MAG TPA: ATP-dependent DNA helicase RecG [Candidatus Binataceae bacterium]